MSVARGDGEVCVAFNRGCDARLAGEPLTSNPYRSGQKIERQAWINGWYDVHWLYGEKARDRWPIKPLPEVESPFDAQKVGAYSEAAVVDASAAVCADAA